MKKIKQIYYDYYLLFFEIKNFISYISTLNKEKITKEFKRLKLRVDYVGRVYTVINLSQDEAKWDEFEKRALILERLRDVNLYLTKLNLHEIITPNIRPVASYEQHFEDADTKVYEYSYLITYTFLFDKFNLWFLFKHTILVYILYKIWSVYSTSIIETISNIFKYVSELLIK